VAAMAGPGAVELASAVVIPERKGVDSLIRTGGRWPDATARQLHRMVEAILDRPTDERIDPSGHVPVVPGSLGHYSDLEVGER
jgi:hypothetical protein